MFSTSHFQFLHRVQWLQGQFLVYQDVVEDIFVTQYYPAVYITNEAHSAGAYAEQRNNMVQITELAQEDVRHDTFNLQDSRVENYWNSRMKNYAHIHDHRRKHRVKPYDINNRGAQRLTKIYDDEFFATYDDKNKNFYFKTEQPNESKDSAPKMSILLTRDNEQVDSDESNHGKTEESGDKCEQQKESLNTNQIKMKDCMRGINEKEKNYFVCHADQNNECKVTAQKQSIHFKCDNEEQDAKKIRLSQTEETEQKAEKQESHNTNDTKMTECLSGINEMGKYLLNLIESEEEDDKESTSNITLTRYNEDNEKQNTTERLYEQIDKTEEMNRKQQTSLNRNVNHTKESVATHLGNVNLPEAHGSKSCSADGRPDWELGGSQKEGDHARRRWWTRAARHVGRLFGLSRRRDAPTDVSTRRASWRRLLCCVLDGGCDD